MLEKICSRCGVLITDELKSKCKENRGICVNCRRKQLKENYDFKKDVYNARRRNSYAKKPKDIIKKCIVCNTEFNTNRDDHKTCSKSCSYKYHRLLCKIHDKKKKEIYAKKRQKDIKNAKVRFKRYTEKEKETIKKYMLLDKDYSFIAKKLGRTVIAIGEIARRLKNAN